MEQEERRQAKIGNPTSGEEVNNVRDKIQLKSSHWPSREELLKKAAEGLVIRCLTVEASFHEEEGGPRHWPRRL